MAILRKNFAECKTIGERILFLRKSKSLSCQQLAASVGCSIGYVSQGENDAKNLSKPMLESFARALSTSPQVLVRGEDNRPSSISRLIEIVNASHDPACVATLIDLLHSIFLLDTIRESSGLDRKRYLLDKYADFVKIGQTPVSVATELILLDKTLAQITARKKQILPFIHL